MELRLFAPGETPSATTVRAVIDAYLEEKTLEQDLGTFSDKGLEKLRHYLGRFAEMYGTQHVDKCQRTDLLRWLKAHPEWKATFTRQDAVGCVMSCFRWAEDTLGMRCPYKRPKFVGEPVKPRPAIKPHEYHGMRAKTRRHRTRRGPSRTALPFRIALLFLWKTGARPCEMRIAEWEGLDWERGLLKTKSKTRMVSGVDRTIGVRRILPLLRWLWAKRRRQGFQYIFVNSIGKPWTCDRFAKEFRRFAKLAGVPNKVSAYCLRHGMCTRLIENGATEREVADVLGQKSTRYVEWYSRELRTKADYLNSIYGKDKTP